MTRFRIFPSLFAVSLLTLAVAAGGCVSTGLELAANHPARAGAGAGAGSDPATILGPDSAFVSGPGREERLARAQEPDGTRENPYVGRGVVRDSSDRALIVDHEAIPGFMGAMTMSYPLADDIDVENLEAGETVRFYVEVPESGGHRIVRVEAIESPAPAGEPVHDHPNPAGPAPRR